jgi:putative selenate reductase FAD-binding subunit
MITSYHRPHTLDEALVLLKRPNTLPLGGGTLLSRPGQKALEVVDLQDLGLNSITPRGNDLEVGAAATLQTLLESEHCPDALKAALKLEAPLNIRNSATVAGALVTCDGRSTLATSLLALDAKLRFASQESNIVTLGDFLPLRSRGLITSIVFPLNANIAFEGVARTPADKPIVCAALAQWPSGRTRLAIGGFGKSPSLALDGTSSEGIEIAAGNACHEAADAYGSAEYRMAAAATLSKRCLEKLDQIK